MFRYEDMRALLSDPRLRSNFPEFLRAFGITGGPFFEWMSISPLNRDGADHQRWRALMSRTFTPRSVERLRTFLYEAAHDLIDGFASRGSCEFMGEFADIYPSLGLCELIGVPSEDRDRFRGWADKVGLGFGPLVAVHIAEVDAALAQLLAYTGDLAAARRAEPRDDLVSRIAIAAREDSWTDFEVQGFIAGLVFAGHDTTRNQLGWMVAALSGRTEVWQALAEGSTPIAETVEEVLRYRPAVTGVGRTVAEAVTLGDERLEAGERVLLLGLERQPRRAGVPEPGAARSGAERRDAAPDVRARRALLPRRRPGARGASGSAGRPHDAHRLPDRRRGRHLETPARHQRTAAPADHVPGARPATDRHHRVTRCVSTHRGART